MKPIDKAIFGMVSESSGRNESDRDGGGNDMLAISNCMNEVCDEFLIESAEWSNRFDAPMSDVESTYRKWLALRLP
jgi:hypothetical protein